MIDKEKLKEMIEERKSLAEEYGAFTTKAKDFDKRFCELLGKPEVKLAFEVFQKQEK